MQDRQVAQLRVPPQSVEAEQAVLGGLLTNNAAWDVVGDLLTENDFYRHEHRLLFAAISGMCNACKPADVITVYESLERQNKHEQCGGLTYLTELSALSVGAKNVRRYAQIVRENSIRRRLVSTSEEIATAAFNLEGRTVEGLLDEAAQKVMAIGNDVIEDEWQSMEQMVVQELDMIQARADGRSDDRPSDCIATGLSDLDEMLDGGMRAGQFIVIGARPGMGKSAFADTVGVHVALDLQLSVGKFSMEMQNHEGGQRAIAARGKIPLHALRRPQRMNADHWSSLTRGIELLRHAPFYSTDKGGLNINQIRSKARALRRKHGLRLLIVDYLQLMSGTDQRVQRTYQLEEASRGLKSLAKELQIPVIALAQVNRGVEKEADQMPRMSDLKDCGSIEQDADIILFLHRPIVTKPDLAPEWKYYAKAHLAKQRGGRTGFLDFQYVGENTRFDNWPEGVPVPVNPVRVRNASSGSNFE
jgi:replicative DNA helicase